MAIGHFELLQVIVSWMHDIYAKSVQAKPYSR